MHVRKGDLVVVLSGNDKGRTGEVKQAYPRDGRVLVEGVNLRWKHRKPGPKNPKGERVQVERPIHASNVRRSEPPAKPAAKGAAKGAKGARKAKGKKG